MSIPTISTNAAFRIVRDTLDKLEVEMPTVVVEELQRFDFRSSVTYAFDPKECADAVVDALLAERNPLTDKKVLGHLLTRQMSELAPMLKVRIEERRADLLASHAETILSALVPVVTDADAVLEKARTEIPNLDLEDRDFVNRLPAEHMTTWGQAREAIGRLTHVVKLWQTLAGACGLAYLSQGNRPLILADLTAAELDSLGPDAKAITPALKGHRLSLAMPADLAARTERMAADLAQRERDTEAANRRAMGSMRGAVPDPAKGTPPKGISDD